MPTSSQELLIIDSAPPDEKLTQYFTQFSFNVLYFNSLDQFQRIKINSPTALLIHWKMIQDNNINLKTFSENLHVPIIVISDISNEEIGIQMLENGADDFLVKPINPRELHARITAIQRRIQNMGKNPQHEKEIISFNQWKLYLTSRQLFNDQNEEIVLSPSEYNLLLAFLRQPQQVLGREFLLQLNKNSQLNPFDRRIDIQISRLRQKIEPDIKRPLLIKTIRNGGYMFVAEVTTSKN